MAREFKFGTGWRAKICLKQLKKKKIKNKNSNVMYIYFFLLQRFDMFLKYVLCVNVFGCQTKGQPILKNSNFLNVRIFLKSKVVFKTFNAQVFLEKYRSEVDKNT